MGDFSSLEESESEPESGEAGAESESGEDHDDHERQFPLTLTRTHILVSLQASGLLILAPVVSCLASIKGPGNSSIFFG
jgi:hypothetical protein